jgi:hypothetical protein
MSNGQTAFHDETGVVFLRDTTSHGKVVRYRDGLLDHTVRRALIDVIVEGKESPIFDRALVRRGRDGEFYYYPLPLIFASKEERELAAKAMNRRPPSERWALRRRRQVLDTLGLSTEL